MRYSVSVVTSIVLHVFLLWISSSSKDSPKSDNLPSQINIHVVNKKIDKNISSSDNQDSKISLKKVEEATEQHKEAKCKDSFIGIGVEISFGPCIVSRVYDGYPASKNGIKVGDSIISPPCDEIVSTKISKIDMVVLRGTNVLNLSFMRDKICGEK